MPLVSNERPLSHPVGVAMMVKEIGLAVSGQGTRQAGLDAIASTIACCIASSRSPAPAGCCSAVLAGSRPLLS